MSRFERRVVSSLRIAAPPAAIWAVLTDVAAWPTWNPACLRATGGPIELGALLDYTLRMSRVPVRFRMVVTELEPERCLSWTGTKWWGVEGRRTFTLSEGVGGTRVDDDKVFRSPWLPIGRLYPEATIRQMSETWLEGLSAAAVALNA